MDELSPIFRSLTEQPAGFFSGFAAGLLRMNLLEDPAKGWLLEQMQKGDTYNASTSFPASTNGTGKGPQSIAID